MQALILFLSNLKNLKMFTHRPGCDINVSPPHNRQVEACIKFLNCTIKTCKWTNTDVHFALFQIRPTLIDTGMSSPATLLFNRSIKLLLPDIARDLINVNNDEEYYKVLKARQNAYIKNNDTHKESTFFSTGSSVPVWREDGSPWMHGMMIKGNEEDH